MKEELQKKHLEAILDDLTNCGTESFNNKRVPQAATACTTITLQTVVDVLESILKNETDGYAVADNAQKKLTEYTNLLNQNK